MAISYDPSGVVQKFDDGSRLITYADGTTSARDTGGQITIKKPDGSGINLSGIIPSLPRGVANAVSGFQNVKAVMNLAGGLVSGKGLITDPSTSGSNQGTNVLGFPNILEQFASYTPVWTFACLTKEQFNDPRSYRNSPAELRNIVFSSAGRYDSQRVRTAVGAPEYFINNFIMNTVVAPNQATGNSSAVKFEFEVYEPYSMGLFLQSLQLAALNSGYPNYLSNTPYVLKLDFLGFDDTGKMFKGVKSKYYTLRLNKVSFAVNESGSTYKILASPFNHLGFSTLTNQLFKDVAITGNTVSELLVAGERSLCAALNDHELQSVKDKKKEFPDIFEVQFPETQDQLLTTSTVATSNTATVKPDAAPKPVVGSNNVSSTDTNRASAEYGNNLIGQSDMGFDQASGGNYVFKKEGDIVDEKTGKIKRDQMTVDPKLRTFQFTQGQSITAVISQIVISCKRVVDTIRNVKLDETGSLEWFKVDVQVQLLQFDKTRGDYQKKIIYRVVPFKTHISVFASPTSAPPGYAELEKKVAKKYSYIYTGQNNDVLTFKIQINNLFYTGINSGSEKDNATVVNKDQNSPTDESRLKTEANSAPAGESALASNTGGGRSGPDTQQSGKSDGGSGDVDEAKKVAEAFNTALLKSNADMVTIDLEILGDPFWLVDSGIGNYFAKVNPANDAITADGTMNYEGGHVYVYLTFRTPNDVNEATGMYSFPDAGKESPFSGIYRVTKCDNAFKDGTFKQTLRCVRMPRQASDFDNKPQPIDAKKSVAVSVTQAEPKPTNPMDTDPSLADLKDFYG